MALLMFILALGLSGISAGSAEYKGKEAWGYVNVRKDAYMFWWLYYTDVSENYSSYPLIIWLQGGPGSSSTGYGNFMEIGPLDINSKPRNTTWVKKANLLFLDNPVGTGFSYVKNISALATNNSQIAADLISTLQSVLKNIPEFQKSPLYIFGESYGGKMAADFAVALYTAVKRGNITCNLKGVAFGDSWISGYDSVASWGQYLYTMSLISKNELGKLNTQVAILKKDIDTHHYADATDMFISIEAIVKGFTGDVNFYNILKHETTKLPDNQTFSRFPKDYKYRDFFKRHVGYFQNQNLSTFMNGPIREKLHVIPKNVTWGGQSDQVFTALVTDFMKPVIESVQYLLNETTLDVIVYSGQLDLICDVVGTMNWIQKLKWPGLKQFMSAEKQFIFDVSGMGAYTTSFKNFHFFWIMKAGHMVPADNGVFTLKMLDMILPKPK